MPNIPIRKIGAVGIIKDANPFDLPPNAFSDGINIRFDNDMVERAPVFRIVYNTLTGTVPVFTYGIYNSSSFDSVVYANNDGRVFAVANATETEVTPAGHTASVDPRAFTGTVLGEYTYLNRPDGPPICMGPSDTKFNTLPNWPSGWRCLSLRAFGSFLFAINLTEGITSYPNMVAWSDAVTGPAVPDSWDATDTTKLAGANTLTQLRTPLVDGGPLGQNFVLYSQDETWLVNYIGGDLLFEWLRLPFDNAGIINQNCWIEIDGKHYVWGENDIYVHDGVTKQSIIDQRNRETLFRELNIKQSGVFFIAHDKYRHEIAFCGVSGSVDAAFQNPNGYCNYGAIYNYEKDTWSFVDLPNVSAASTANVNTVWTYATVPASLTYSSVGGSYFDQQDSFSRFCVMSSVADPNNGLPNSSLYVLDSADTGRLALAVDPNTVKPAWAMRTGLDLDVVGAPIRGYKSIRSVFPLISTTVQAPMTMQFGAHLVSSGPVVWAPAQTYDPTTQYKLDIRGGGRFLAYKFIMPTGNDFEASGMDVDAVITGKR